MPPFAISSNLFAQFPRHKAFQFANELGFRFMDLWASPVLANHVDPRTEDPEVVRAEVEKYGVKPICMSIYYATFEEKVDRFRFAGRVGIPYITFAVAPQANYLEKMTGMDIEGRTLTPPGAGWNVFIEVLTELLDAAEESGVRIALQVPHVYTLIETADELKRLRDDLQHPALYFAVSPTHAVARGSKLEEFVDICGDRLAITHLWNVKPDYVAESDDRAWGSPAEQLAVKGFYDLTQLARTMQERDETPYLCVKCHGTESWTDAQEIMSLVRKSTAGLRLQSD